MNSNFDFDLGLGSNRPKSLNDPKNKPTTSSSSYQSKPSWQQPTTTWTHQPAAPLNGPASMVGDIFGKSWSSTAAPSVSATPIHVVNKNPNLFGDLLSSAMSKPISSANSPLKNAAPNSAKSSFSMGNVADSLPKSTTSGINWGNSSISVAYNSSTTSKINNGVNAASTKSPSIGGGSSLRNMSGGGGGMGAKKDPFGSLVDLASKPAGGMKSTAAAASKASYTKRSAAAPATDPFCDFQNAPKPTSATTTTTTSGGGGGGGSFTGSDPFSGFNDFGAPANQQKPVPVQSTSSDPLDMFATFSLASASGGVGVEQSSGIDDLGTEFGGGADEGDFGGSTTELEGLPPPPAGVSASGAKSKGMDNYKQGQYPDAIKWLSWAVVLLEKGADRSALADVLSSRASCYKEVGEYKKAVADCTKVLEKDDANVSVLVQRALLYESMEKYRLGAEDLRNVLRIDPGNRVARGTIHRLTKLAD